MALERVKRFSKIASVRESRILGGLEAYYRGEGSLGYVAGELKIPPKGVDGIHGKTETSLLLAKGRPR